ncbi:MAG: AAA family ATPase [Cyanobacteriota bacterium]|nr:AAA family ATPase [Cyanobacteriota bacterium]
MPLDAMTVPIVKRFLVSFDEHKLLGLCSFAAIVAAAGAFSMLPPPPPTPPKYTAIGKLRFSAPPPTFTQTGASLQQQGQQVAISEETLLSPDIIEPVAQELDAKPDKLANKVKIVFPQKEEGGKKKKGGGDDQKEPFEIQVQYQQAAESDASPDKLEAGQSAIAAVSLLMDEMVEKSRSINTALLRAKIDSLQTRLAEAQRDQQIAEKAYYNFISEEGASLVAAEDGSLFAGISGMQQQQRQIKLTLEGVDAQIASISSQLGMNPDQAYTSSMLSADPIIGNLRGQLLNIEMQLEPLREKLRPEHPTMKQIMEQKRSVERLLQDRYAELIDTGVLAPLPGQIRKESSLDPARQQLANTLVTLNTQRDTLLSQLESVQRQERELRQQYENFPTKQLEKARLQQQLQVKQTLYNNMLSSLLDAQSAEAETTGSLTVSQTPLVEETPGEVNTGLNPLLAIGAGTAAGLVAAGGIIFLLSMLDPRVHTAKEIQGILSEREVALLGVLPWVFNRNEEGEEVPILQSYNQGDLHYYELFRSNLRRGAAKSAKTILLTSESAEEGKTVTAYNLAIASANAGKRTLLVEADLHSPSAAPYVRVEPELDSRLEPLSYYSSRSEYLQLVPDVANLYIVPGAGPQSKAAAVLESSEFKRLLEDAKGRFDCVIIDAPALSACNDALLLEPLVDGIVIVARPGVTQKSSLASRLDTFVETELPLLGVAINAVETNELPAIPLDNLEPELAPQPLPRLQKADKLQSFEESESEEAEELLETANRK